MNYIFCLTDDKSQLSVATVSGVSRRTLLGAGAGAGLAVAAGAIGSTRATGAPASAAAAAAHESLLPPKRIGLQLYSVRDAIAAQGFDNVFGTLAAIGFRHVEFAGYTQDAPITIQELRALLDKHGLKAAGSHVSASNDAAMTQILDEAEILGIPQVGNSLVLPDGAPTVDGWKGAAETANRFGEMASKRGMSYYLHNHFQEWLPSADDSSKSGHDVFLAELDPRFTFLELDIFWAYVGASQRNNDFDPLRDYAIPHRDRYKLFHCKDGVYDTLPAGEITDFGEGKIDYQTFFTELFNAAPGEEKKHIYLWERDNASEHPRGSLAAARASYVNIRHGLVGELAETTDCVNTVRARLQAVRVRGRRVRATLHVREPVEVTARLVRDGATLAQAKTKLRRGIRSVSIRAPHSVATGPATLRLSLTDGAGKKKSIRRTVALRSAP